MRAEALQDFVVLESALCWYFGSTSKPHCVRWKTSDTDLMDAMWMQVWLGWSMGQEPDRGHILERGGLPPEDLILAAPCPAAHQRTRRECLALYVPTFLQPKSQPVQVMQARHQEPWQLCLLERLPHLLRSWRVAAVPLTSHHMKRPNAACAGQTQP